MDWSMMSSCLMSLKRLNRFMWHTVADFCSFLIRVPIIRMRLDADLSLMVRIILRFWWMRGLNPKKLSLVFRFKIKVRAVNHSLSVRVDMGLWCMKVKYSKIKHNLNTLSHWVGRSNKYWLEFV